MNVLLIGSGGREHALAWKISQSPKLTKLYCAPGNAGMTELGECVPIKADDIEALLTFAKEKKIDLTVVGPESPLVAGIVDRFESEGLLIFGPNQKAAQIEGSKIFAKEIMREAGVPTANFQVFTDVKAAKHHIIERESPFLVIKSDGLAAGKGVVVASSSEEAITAVNQMITERVFGDAGTKVVIEDRLVGDELSVLVLTDGETTIPLASSQDHKRIYDNDQGPNTGGMGAYSPCPLVDDERLKEIVRQTAQPVIQLLKQKGIVYRGVLYVGIMLTEQGPYVLEYNARLGDPETQAVLPRLKTDLLPVLLEIAKGRLLTTSLEWDSRACISVVLASKGYPGHYDAGFEISGFEAVKKMEDVQVFHAGTKLDENKKVVTAGGRVLNVGALGVTLAEAQAKAYEAVRKISFQNKIYRSDIGKRGIVGKVSVHR